MIHFSCVFLLLSREDLAVTVSLYYPVFSEAVHCLSFRVMWPKRSRMGSPMWKRFLSTSTHLQVQDNTLNYACVYIEKIHGSSSHVQSWNMQVFHRDYLMETINQSIQPVEPRLRLTWTRVCQTHLWTGFHLGFLSSVRLDHRAQTCARDAPKSARARWEETVDGDLMSSFRTHVPIITFEGSISVKTLPSVIYCCKHWHVAG